MPAKGIAGRTKSEAARQRKDPTQNLIPITKENAAEMGRRGGLKAQVTLRRKRKLKECLKLILELPPTEKQKEALARMGIEDEDMNNQMVMASAMFVRATKGDVRAAEYIRDLTGQQPESKLDKARTKLMLAQAEALKKANDDTKELTKLDELLHGIDKIAEEPDGTDS